MMTIYEMQCDTSHHRYTGSDLDTVLVIVEDMHNYTVQPKWQMRLTLLRAARHEHLLASST